MSRQDHGADEPGLFDLPLETNTAASRRGRPLKTEHEALPKLAGARASTAPDAPADGSPIPQSRHLRAVPAVAPGARADHSAGLGRRLLAGLGDLALHAAVYVLMLAGARYLGVELRPAALGATGIALLLFSLLYTVIPLAFWGQTPGMSWAGIVSRSTDGEPLSFGQSTRQWIGSLLTLLLAGLPTLLAPGGRSLCDRLSGASTFATQSV